MERSGVITNVVGKDRVTLRVTSLKPYTSEYTVEQVKVLEEIAERYGSRKVHVTPRQSIEIPDIFKGEVDSLIEKLEKVGLKPGSSGNSVRNIFSCSRWCLYSAVEVSELAGKISQKYGGAEMPRKVLVSFSECDFSCGRSRTSDIGIMGYRKLKVLKEKCIKCNACMKDPLGCQVVACDVENEVLVNPEKCVRCGFCSNVCPTDAITAEAKGFNVLIGGKGGRNPRFADLYAEFLDEEGALKAVDRILARYKELAEDGERIGDVIDRAGIEVFR